VPAAGESLSGGFLTRPGLESPRQGDSRRARPARRGRRVLPEADAGQCDPACSATACSRPVVSAGPAGLPGPRSAGTRTGKVFAGSAYRDLGEQDTPGKSNGPAVVSAPCRATSSAAGDGTFPREDAQTRRTAASAVQAVPPHRADSCVPSPLQHPPAAQPGTTGSQEVANRYSSTADTAGPAATPTPVSPATAAASKQAARGGGGGGQRRPQLHGASNGDARSPAERLDRGGECGDVGQRDERRSAQQHGRLAGVPGHPAERAPPAHA